ncbi:ABC transporter ATP-binding protein [Sorangium sp. So ce1128]
MEKTNQGIELDRITRARESDGRAYLEDISITLPPGSFNVLLGRTRSGKTSLLRVLAGLDRPTSGAIRDGGADVTRLDARRRDVAMVYQQFVNYPSLSVYENIASPLRAKGSIPEAEIDRRVRETAASLRLTDLLKRLPAELSGGQQQRTAMARALVKDARLLLLDEPLANLDYKLREELRAEMRSLFERRSGVVVYATAEPAEALLLGGNVAVLEGGRLLQSGPALEVYRAPKTTRVGQIFSEPELNLLPGEVAEEGILPSGARFPLAGHLAELRPGRYRFGLRANHIQLAPQADFIRLPAVVESEEITGSQTRIYASVGEAPVTALVDGVFRHALGSRLDLFLSPASLFVFGDDDGLVAAPPHPKNTNTNTDDPRGEHGPD